MTDSKWNYLRICSGLFRNPKFIQIRFHSGLVDRIAGLITEFQTWILRIYSQNWYLRRAQYFNFESSLDVDFNFEGFVSTIVRYPNFHNCLADQSFKSDVCWDSFETINLNRYSMHLANKRSEPNFDE